MSPDWWSPLVQLAVVAPLVVVALVRREVSGARAVAAAGVFLAVAYAWRVPQLDPRLSIGDWNWTGKLLALALACAILAVIHRLRMPHFVHLPRRDSLALVAGVAALLLVPAVVAGYLSRGAAFDGETLAFQATVPGLDEEIAFRGLVLALLVPVGATSVRRCALAVVTVALLFGAVHGVKIGEDGALIVQPGYLAWTAGAGLAWGWMTIRARSMLPALLSHNATNTLGYAMTLA